MTLSGAKDGLAFRLIKLKECQLKFIMDWLVSQGAPRSAEHISLSAALKALEVMCQVPELVAEMALDRT